MTQMSILTDVTRCIGCEECVEACKKTNNTGEDKPWRWQKRIDDLSATRWTTASSRTSESESNFDFDFESPDTETCTREDTSRTSAPMCSRVVRR